MDYIDVNNQQYLKIAKCESIHPKIKIEMIDNSEKNMIRDITKEVQKDSVSITENCQQGVRLTCSFTLINTDGSLTPSHDTGVLWIGSKFRIYIGLTDPDSGDTYWFPKGIYYVSNVNSSRREKTVSVEGIDKFGMLSGDLGYSQLTGTYQFKAGQKVYSVIRDILMLDMGNGTVIDPISPIFDANYKNELLPYDINKSSGGVLGDILIELANVLGCNIFYDYNGHLNIESGTLDISYSQDASIWDFEEILPEYVDSSLNYDYTNVINCVTVVGNNVNDKIYSYTAENNNVLSPTRIEYIGRKEGEPTETSMAYSDARAKEYAQFLLKRKSIMQSTVDFTCTLLPHLAVDKVIAITDKYYGFIQERFIIQSIDVGSDGLMQISASNIAQLPYYELLVGGES